MALSVALIFSAYVTAQDKIQNTSFEITAEAHGFMCPFLTPKYMELIHKLDSCKVWKTDDLVIHVDFIKSTTDSEEQLISAAETIGYERKNITVKRK